MDKKTQTDSHRRDLLLQEMSHLNKKKIDCHSCQAPCCTYQHNSMQITPLEAKEIAQWLLAQPTIFSKCLKSIQQSITDFRLDKKIALNKRLSVRRTYTCPFYEKPPHGCQLPREIKPYGCLAFNPLVPQQLNGGDCQTNKVLLKNREQLWEAEENEQNHLLKQELNLSWEKESIPMAVLEVSHKLSK
jgi:hypothetical protein